MSLVTKNVVPMLLVGVGFATFIGCGGGGSGPTALSGKTAARAAVIGGNQGSANGGKFLLPLLTASSPSSSPFYLFSRLSKTRGPQFDSVLNLYYTNTVAGNTWRQDYFVDSAATVSAGSISATEPGQTTFTNSFTTYPAVVQLTTNVTAGNLPSKGTGTVTFLNSSGANTLKTQISLPKTNVSVATDMSMDGTGAVGGTITAQTNGLTATVTGLSGSVINGFTGKVAVAPLGYTGTATINLTTGDFSAHLIMGGGLTADATVSGSQQLSLAFSDNTTLTVNNALTASPDGNPTTGSTTGTTATGTTATGTTATGTTATGSTATTSTGSTAGTIGNHGSATPTYDSPVPIPGPVDQYGNSTVAIAGALPTGQIIGNLRAGAGTYYWSSPTAQPVALPPLAGYSSLYTTVSGIAMVSGAVEIVGTSSDSHNTNTQAVLWRDPAKAPIALPQIGGNYVAVPLALNSSEQIVGTSQAAPMYWASPTATPQALPQDPSGLPIQANALLDNGIAANLNFNGFYFAPQSQAAFYPSGVTSTSTPVIPPSGYGVFAINNSGLAIGTVETTSFQAGTWSSADGYAAFHSIGKPASALSTYGLAVDAAGDLLIKAKYTDYSQGLLYQAVGASTSVDISNQIPNTSTWAIDPDDDSARIALQYHVIFSDGSVLCYGRPKTGASFEVPVYVHKK